MSLSPHPSLLVVDGFNLAYRAYNVWPAHLTNPAGQQINMVVGMVTIIHAATKRIPGRSKVVIAWEGGPNWRTTEYPAYKAGRKSRPPEFDAQLPLVHQALDILGVLSLTTEGAEADDVIASLATHASGELPMFVLSNDRDLFQIVRPHVLVMLPPAKKGESHRFIDRLGVLSLTSVEPRQIPDFKALVGDTSDNLPGVTGIGPTAAKALLTAFGDLEGIIRAVETGDIRYPRWLTLVAKYADDAILTKRLATLITDLPMYDVITALERAFLPWGTQYTTPDLAECLRPLGLEKFATIISEGRWR